MKNSFNDSNRKKDGGKNNHSSLSPRNGQFNGSNSSNTSLERKKQQPRQSYRVGVLTSTYTTNNSRKIPYNSVFAQGYQQSESQHNRGYKEYLNNGTKTPDDAKNGNIQALAYNTYRPDYTTEQIDPRRLGGNSEQINRTPLSSIPQPGRIMNKPSAYLTSYDVTESQKQLGRVTLSQSQRPGSLTSFNNFVDDQGPSVKQFGLHQSIQTKSPSLTE